MDSIWWQVFDVLGTIAFALSGVLVAVSRRMDIFGVFVLSAATAVGGGIVRDVLAGYVPPTAFRSELYFWLIVATIGGTVLVLRYTRGSRLRRTAQYSRHVYLWCDAIGLGSFTITGTLVGYSLYPEWWVFGVTVGVITAVGGGVIRDVLAGLIPGVLKKEIYATASLVGAALLYGLLAWTACPVVLAAVPSFLVTVSIRLIAVRFRWNLPRIKRHKSGQWL